MTFLLIVCAILLQNVVLGIKVERVYFKGDTEWAPQSPVYVMCDVKVETGEEVHEVTWRHEGDLVYRWLFNETVEVFGVLEDKLDTSNTSDWNIKVERLGMELEGNFSCTAATEQNVSDTNSFMFIIFYAPNSSHNAWLSEEDCTVNVTVWFPRVYPRPVVTCIMVHEQSSSRVILNGTDHSETNPDGTRTYQLNASILISDYEEGSYLKCSNLVYGDYIDILVWTPKENPSCPEPVPAHPGFTLNTTHLMPGCRSGIKGNSRAVYTCNYDSNEAAGSTCYYNGTWEPDLNENKYWPKCSNSGNKIITTSSLILLLLQYFILN